jgi:hypothetical protein
MWRKLRSEEKTDRRTGGENREDGEEEKNRRQADNMKSEANPEDPKCEPS